ncbi:unnamed protein product [Dovyalis caffra]|uniref:Dynein light chain n=1 Tax=Dovyalis caffra TaxID=77055 RepID=A0AAV1SKD3_9ROSI|nr:unnamed protein product [Dovyalis caffra]
MVEGIVGISVCPKQEPVEQGMENKFGTERHPVKQVYIIPREAIPLTPPLSLFNSSPSPVTKHPSTMLEGKAIVGETDMLQTMQQDALHLAAKALDTFDVTESTDIACFIKKDFDRVHGPGWQCIVGMDFGSFVTHYRGCFIHFSIGNLAILLFKGLGNQVEDREKLHPTLEIVDA